MSFFYSLGGSRNRTPGAYRRQESANQHGTLVWILVGLGHRVLKLLGRSEPSMPKLHKTNETIHSSVRIRRGKKGLGYNDKGIYNPPALQGFVVHGLQTNPDTPIATSEPGPEGEMTGVVWKKPVYPENVIDGKVQVLTSKGKTDNLELPEEPLGLFERRVLELWPEIQKDFDTLSPDGAQT